MERGEVLSLTTQVAPFHLVCWKWVNQHHAHMQVNANTYHMN